MTISHFRTGTAALALLIAFAPAPALAQAAAPISAEEAAALRAEIDALRAQVSALAARLDGAAATPPLPAPAPAPAAPVVTAAAPTPAPAPAAASASVRLRGRIQIDAGFVNAPDALVDRGLGFSTELRRVYLGVDGTIPGGFGYRLEADFADNDIALTDAYLNWTRGPLTLTLGNQKTFASMEDQTSDLFTSFMERAMFNSAFGFERRVGLSAAWQGDVVRVEAGLFSDDVDTLINDEANGYSIDGHIVATPRLGATQLLLGASAHLRDLNDATPAVRYQTRPFLHSTNTRFANTGLFSATGERAFGLETGLIHGRFHWAGEAAWMTARRPGLADPTFFGGYAEVGYFLTDDHRNFRRGVFDRSSVTNPITNGGMGALELNLRYDWLDLVDAGIVGGHQSTYGVALAWHPVSAVRFYANYVRVAVDQAAVSINGDQSYGADVIGMRAQFDF